MNENPLSWSALSKLSLKDRNKRLRDYQRSLDAKRIAEKESKYEGPLIRSEEHRKNWPLPIEEEPQLSAEEFTEQLKRLRFKSE